MHFPSDEPVPDFDIYLCAICGINALVFDVGDYWNEYAHALTAHEHTVTAADIDYNGELVLWGTEDGTPRCQVAAESPETYLNTQRYAF